MQSLGKRVGVLSMGVHGRLGGEKDRGECGRLKGVDHDHGHLLDLDVRGLACFHVVQSSV